MVALNEFSLRMFWISYLLIGSVASFPVPKDSNNPLPESGFSSSSYGMGESASSFAHPSRHTYAGAQDEGYNVPQASAYESEASLLAGSYYGPNVGGYYDASYFGVKEGQDGSSAATAYDATSFVSGYGAGGYGSVAYNEVPETSEGDGEESNEKEIPEAVFSDVSDLEPVYSFSSRSRYQHGRTTYSKTTYTPGEVLMPPVLPVFKGTSNPSASLPKRPVNTPSKGGR